MANVTELSFTFYFILISKFKQLMWVVVAISDSAVLEFVFC